PNSVTAGVGDVPVSFTGTFFSTKSKVVVKQGNSELLVLDTDSRTRTATHLDAVIPGSITSQTGTYTILVRNFSDQPFDSAGFTFTVGQSTSKALVRNINFGSATMGLPVGFNGRDSGQVFSPIRGFGWSSSMINYAVGPVITRTINRTI